MSTYLYRLGHWAFRRRWLVLGVWVALLVGMGMLDKRAWWLPSWLERKLPNLDIEGEKLMHQLEVPEPERSAEPVPS